MTMEETIKRLALSVAMGDGEPAGLAVRYVVAKGKWSAGYGRMTKHYDWETLSETPGGALDLLVEKLKEREESSC